MKVTESFWGTLRVVITLLIMAKIISVVQSGYCFTIIVFFIFYFVFFLPLVAVILEEILSPSAIEFWKHKCCSCVSSIPWIEWIWTSSTWVVRKAIMDLQSSPRPLRSCKIWSLSAIGSLIVARLSQEFLSWVYIPSSRVSLFVSSEI